MALTKEGYEKRTPEAIKELLTRELQNKAVSFNTLPADVQNNLLDTTIPVLMQFENIAAEILNGYGPDYANDFIWLNLANSLGLLRKAKVKAQVELKFTGDPGTYIPRDTQVGAFKTDDSVTLDSTGVAYVIAYSEEDGVFAEAETLTEINATISDSLEVVNPEASIESLEEETIEELRDRSRAILRSSRKGGIDYAIAKLKSVKGVNPQLVKFRFVDYNYEVVENDIKVLKNTRGIEAIIGGGDANQVAGALFDSFLETAKLISEPSNNETDRTMNTILDYYGSKLPIQFTRPKNISLKFRLIFTFKGVLVTSTSAEGIIKQPLTDFINNRQLGAPLNKNTLDALIFSKFAEHGIDTTGFVKIDYTINKGEELVQFDSEGFLDIIKHDCYLTLAGLNIEIASSQSKIEGGNQGSNPGTEVQDSTPPPPPPPPVVEEPEPEPELELEPEPEPQRDEIQELQTSIEELKRSPEVRAFNEAQSNFNEDMHLVYKYMSADKKGLFIGSSSVEKNREISKREVWSDIHASIKTLYNTKIHTLFRAWLMNPKGAKIGRNLNQWVFGKDAQSADAKACAKFLKDMDFENEVLKWATPEALKEMDDVSPNTTTTNGNTRTEPWTQQSIKLYVICCIPMLEGVTPDWEVHRDAMIDAYAAAKPKLDEIVAKESNIEQIRRENG